MLTIVLDSNLLVSVLLTPEGESTEVLRRARAHTVCVSSYILAEVKNTLHSPRLRKRYQYSDEAIERHLRGIRIFSERVEPKISLEVCAAPNDNAVLACAVEAHADYLVTRNKKDFPKEYAGVKVVSPQSFLALTNPALMPEQSTPTTWPMRIKKWLRAHPKTSTMLGVFFTLLLSGWLILFAGLPSVEEIKAFKPHSTVKAGRMNWNKRSTDSIRIYVPLAKISPLLQQAVVISEDDLFYQHNGFNIPMMKEAFRVNLEKKRYVRGASTITMQLARNAFLHKRKTLVRKLREIVLTRRIEEALTKKQILEMYLNIVELGEGIYGAEAAARFYFDKPASQLTLAEASLLAAMLPNPIYFNPYKRMKTCGRMQKRVLDLMALSRVITAEQAQAAGPSAIWLPGTSAPVVEPTPRDSTSSSTSSEPFPEELDFPDREAEITSSTPDSVLKPK